MNHFAPFDVGNLISAFQFDSIAELFSSIKASRACMRREMQAAGVTQPSTIKVKSISRSWSTGGYRFYSQMLIGNKMMKITRKSDRRRRLQMATVDYCFSSSHSLANLDDCAKKVDENHTTVCDAINKQKKKKKKLVPQFSLAKTKTKSE